MRFFFSLVLITIAFWGQAQSYNTALGVRFGDDLKFSLSQRVASKITLDANFSNGLFSDNKYGSLVFKKHSNILTRRFNIFLGAGIYGSSAIREGQETEDFNFNSSGIAGTMGFDFTLGRVNLSMDYNPHFATTRGLGGKRLFADSALSIRYVLWSRKSSMKKFFQKIF
jgi:hypothetical protein